MPVPSISIKRAKGQPQNNPATDFAMCIIGAASKNPGAAGALSVPYGSPDAVFADRGIGDGVDATTQALAPTDDNPSPPQVSFVGTTDLATTTAGVRGTIAHTGVTGTAVPTATASTHPLGTWEVVGVCTLGGTAGTGPIKFKFSLDGGRTFLPEVTITTALTIKVQIPNPGSSAIDTGVQYDYLTASTWVTGDTWSETVTTPPQWAHADLYTAGSPASGVLPSIAMSSQNFGLIAITEPAAATDIAFLSAALDAMKAIKASCRPTLIVRFRDQAAGESDSTFIAAWQTFQAACAKDARICCVVGNGWLTDAYRQYVLNRNGVASLLARIQGMSTIEGVKGERIAQHPGWTARGPLPDFTIRDPNGNQVGHDERVRGGILGPIGGQGGGICFYYESHEEVKGTYVANADALYDVLPTVVSLMDNRVSSAIERVLYAVSFRFLNGADIVTSGVIDDDTRDGMSAAAQRVIARDYANEFANATDPNLVTVDPNVTVSGLNVTFKWYVNDKLYDYTNAIIITVANTRS